MYNYRNVSGLVFFRVYHTAPYKLSYYYYYYYYKTKYIKTTAATITVQEPYSTNVMRRTFANAGSLGVDGMVMTLVRKVAPRCVSKLINVTVAMATRRR